MTKTANPFEAFDMTKMFADFDPSKFTTDFSKMAKDMNIPTVDVDAVVKLQQKNIEALTAANKTATESVKALAARQSEILQETMKETQDAINKLARFQGKLSSEVTIEQVAQSSAGFMEWAFSDILQKEGSCEEQANQVLDCWEELAV